MNYVLTVMFFFMTIILIIAIITIIFAGPCSSLYNCLGWDTPSSRVCTVQRLYCNPFPAKLFSGCHSMDLVMIQSQPPGIENGAFMVSSDSVWYALFLLLFSTSAATDTDSKSFNEINNIIGK